MTHHQTYIVSISFVALLSFFILGAFVKNVVVERTKPNVAVDGLEPIESPKDVFSTPGGADQAPEVLATDPSLGPLGAKVTIQIFSDFQCPFCATAHRVVRQVQANHPNEIRVVWKDFPLPTHAGAREMAYAARCAQDAGKFWEFVDAIFEPNNTETTSEQGKTTQAAKEVGLDIVPFNRCLVQNTHVQEVGNSITQGINANIDAVPYLFVNEQIISGQPTQESLEALVLAELRK